MADVAVTEVKVAVSAEDGEKGVFVPVPREDQLLIAATLAVALAGRYYSAHYQRNRRI